MTLILQSLFDDPPIVVERPLTAQEKFEQFDRENPLVYLALRKMALELVDRGTDRFAIATLFEVLRWRHYMRTTGSEFKLNNSHRAFYSRLLAKNEPRLADVFETRKSRADEIG